MDNWATIKRQYKSKAFHQACLKNKVNKILKYMGRPDHYLLVPTVSVKTIKKEGFVLALSKGHQDAVKVMMQMFQNDLPDDKVIFDSIMINNVINSPFDDSESLALLKQADAMKALYSTKAIGNSDSCSFLGLCSNKDKSQCMTWLYSRFTPILSTIKIKPQYLRMLLPFVPPCKVIEIMVNSNYPIDDDDFLSACLATGVFVPEDYGKLLNFAFTDERYNKVILKALDSITVEQVCRYVPKSRVDYLQTLPQFNTNRQSLEILAANSLSARLKMVEQYPETLTLDAVKACLEQNVDITTFHRMVDQLVGNNPQSLLEFGANSSLLAACSKHPQACQYVTNIISQCYINEEIDI